MSFPVDSAAARGYIKSVVVEECPAETAHALAAKLDGHETSTSHLKMLLGAVDPDDRGTDEQVLRWVALASFAPDLLPAAMRERISNNCSYVNILAGCRAQMGAAMLWGLTARSRRRSAEIWARQAAEFNAEAAARRRAPDSASLTPQSQRPGSADAAHLDSDVEKLAIG